MSIRLSRLFFLSFLFSVYAFPLRSSSSFGQVSFAGQGDLECTEILHIDANVSNTECIVGVDVGGTNTDFGFFVVEDKKPVLALSVHVKTKAFAKLFADQIRCNVPNPGYAHEQVD